MANILKKNQSCCQSLKSTHNIAPNVEVTIYQKIGTIPYKDLSEDILNNNKNLLIIDGN